MSTKKLLMRPASHIKLHQNVPFVFMCNNISTTAIVTHLQTYNSAAAIVTYDVAIATAKRKQVQIT